MTLARLFPPQTVVIETKRWIKYKEKRQEERKRYYEALSFEKRGKKKILLGISLYSEQGNASFNMMKTDNFVYCFLRVYISMETYAISYHSNN